MTGFGKGVAASPDRQITVEIKSLNSKQMDLFMRVPSYFRATELTLRSRAAEALSRGKVEVSVTVDSLAAHTSASINVPVVEQYKEQILEMATRLQIAWPQDWYATLLRLPDALRQDEPELTEADIRALLEAFDAAVAAIREFREHEGAKLDTFFRAKIASISALLEQVTPFEQARVPAIRERLETELAALHSVDYDKGRLEQELIFYIEKLDVTEEKTRLGAHLAYFLETMDAPGPQGKKLGFIAQEMGREINTLGSKSNDAGMQRLVVRMKDELEQIKEQVLNVL